jgi:hypothetical protein
MGVRECESERHRVSSKCEGGTRKGRSVWQSRPGLKVCRLVAPYKTKAQFCPSLLKTKVLSTEVRSQEKSLPSRPRRSVNF